MASDQEIRTLVLQFVADAPLAPSIELKRRRGGRTLKGMQRLAAPRSGAGGHSEPPPA